MASTIAIHVGGTGIRLGRQLWDVLFAEHGVSRNGTATTQSIGSGADFFAPAGGTRFVPRAIVTDSDTDAIGALSGWTHRSLLKPDNIVFGSSSCSNNFATGYLRRTDLRDDVLTRVNATVADSPLGDLTFLLTHSLAGGTGGGLTAAIVDELRSQHPSATIICCAVIRNRSGSSIPTQPYNEICALDRLQRMADLVVLLDNQMLAEAVNSKFGTIPSGFVGHNKLAARALGLFTSPARLPVRHPIGFRELTRTLAPFPSLNLVGLAMETWGKSTNGDLVAAVRQTHNRISGIPTARNKVLSPMFIASKGRKLSATTLRKDSRLQIPTWYPPAVSVAKTRSPDGSSLLVENSTGVNARLHGIVAQFDRLFKRNAFLHLYQGDGLSKAAMASARKNVNDLATAYENAG